MKASHTALVLIPLLALPALAETMAERELAQVMSQHERAVASAVEPVNRRTLATLESLLLKTTRAGDLDGANKIKAEVDRFRFMNKPRPMTAEALMEAIAETTWTWGTPGTNLTSLKFHRGGLAEWGNTPQKVKYSAKDSRTLIFDGDTLIFSEDMSSYAIPTYEQKAGNRREGQRKQ